MSIVVAAFTNWHGAAGLWSFALEWITRALTAEDALAAGKVAVPRQPECVRLGCPECCGDVAWKVVRGHWACDACWNDYPPGVVPVRGTPRATGESKGCT